jgi:deferrochelatase/peroxidase EfeB
VADGVLRRRVLLQGAAGAAVGMAGVAACGGPPEKPAPEVRHPPGVISPPPDRSAFVALDVTAGDRAGLAALLERLSGRIAATAGSAVTVTLGAGAALFDGRYGLAGRKPAALRAMPSFAGDVLDPGWCHGDLLLQVCAPQPDAVTAAVTDLLAAAGEGAEVRWRIDGFRPENGLDADGRPTTRNLFGFREGAGNPDPGDRGLMDRLVWVGGAAWTAGGTYQVVRLVRFGAVWNTEPVPRQEAVIGRYKTDGAPLGHTRETEPFDYQADPDGRMVPLDAHVRRANPRRPETEGNRILRRGYSYRRDADEGLVFVCFQRDIEAGFATVQRRLDGEALGRYVLTFGGGYFFVPPEAASLGALLRA